MCIRGLQKANSITFEFAARDAQRKFHARGHAKLVVDVAHVPFDRFPADAQLLANFLVGQPGQDDANDLLGAVL